MERRVSRSQEIGLYQCGLHHAVVNMPVDELKPFEAIIDRLRISVEGAVSGSNSRKCLTLHKHSLFVSQVKTSAVYFEATDFLTEEMQSQLTSWMSQMPGWDEHPRRCHRALANYYETRAHLRSNNFKPLLAPHRDDVEDADISIVLGLTPTSSFRGALLFVSVLPSGDIWMNSPEIPSRKSVSSVEVSLGKCVFLKNKVCHYVSALQSGSRSSIVFHMKKRSLTHE